jgi:pimeloyl-ACP methyl ester carboxylesterase
MSNKNALMKKKKIRGIKIAGMIYASGALAMYFFQKKIMLRPKMLPHNYRFVFDIPFIEINIPFEDYNISLVKFLPPNAIPKGVILYFHGNRGNINRYAKYVPNLTKHGYEVWMTDYPGYGKTTGQFTEENVYLQAGEIYRLATARFNENRIIVYGRSLGSGIASWLASKKQCKHLILETPYYSVPDLFKSYVPIYPVNAIMKFKFPTGEYLKQVTAPVIIFHGTNDWVIPYSCAEKLKKALKPGDEFVTVEKASHNDMVDFPVFHSKLDAILSS